MPELPTVLFCCAVMETCSALLEVVFKPHVEATTSRSNTKQRGATEQRRKPRSDLGLHAAPLAAAVAEANASVLREGPAVKAST